MGARFGRSHSNRSSFVKQVSFGGIGAIEFGRNCGRARSSWTWSVRANSVGSTTRSEQRHRLAGLFVSYFAKKASRRKLALSRPVALP